MAETSQLGLPLLQPAQAQKHVTVNEAFARLDGLVQLRLQSRSVTLPPEAAAEGAVWAVADGAAGDWAGQGGRLAVSVNGGWVFADPLRGWRGWVVDENCEVLHDGDAWRAGVVALSPSNAAMAFRVVEFDHEIAAGAQSQTGDVIPHGTLVFAVTARVVEPITGTASTWSLGNPGAEDRFGSGLGLGAGSFARGLLGSPMAFYSDTALVLTAAGGVFAGGLVRLALHLYEPGIPDL